jgi:hypothetical protein
MPRTGGRTGHDGAGFLLPFGRRPSLLGHPVPPGDSAPLTIGLPHRQQAARTRAGFPCSARMRPGWLRVPSVPRGRRCPHDRSYSRPPPAASQRPAPAAPDCNPPRDASLTRHQRGFTVVHPTPAFPSPVTPGGTGSSGFPLSFAPSRAGPGNARQGGDRPGHCLDYVSGISQPPSTYSLTTRDLTSQELDNLSVSNAAASRKLDHKYSAGRLNGLATVRPTGSVTLRDS